MPKKHRVLVVEPYYGGSHQSFLQGLMDGVDADYTLLTLPARRWKMRMQLSAPWFALQLRKQSVADRWYDIVLCSTFVDVAVMRAMFQQVEGTNPAARYCTYYHENQFAYPGQHEDGGIHQFQSISFNTALASDKIAFNSAFNRDTFFNSCGKYLKKSSDMQLGEILTGIAAKSIILHPGIDYTCIDSAPEPQRKEPPVIVWNHRWEHDKNPDEFFSVLGSLKNRGVPFQLIVLGQSFSSCPECFGQAKEFFADRILYFGYADSKVVYAELLSKGDIVVSTALHEFFGIAVLEAVRAGCRPLLPRRLSYPELFPDAFLYGDGELEGCLEELLSGVPLLAKKDTSVFTDHYCWSRQGEKFRDWLFG